MGGHGLFLADLWGNQNDSHVCTTVAGAETSETRAKSQDLRADGGVNAAIECHFCLQCPEKFKM